MDVPLETLDQDTVETYYKDGNALFSVTIDKAKRVDAVNDIRAIVGEENAMTGSAVSTAAATTSTVSQISKISAIAVLFVILVLILTTDSWFEPVIVMIGLGVAIVINAGSNLIFGEISFVTNAAGSILQLAVSMDHSVFLIHRFTECRQEIDDPKEAMVEALTMSTSSILSSGLTTVIGFIALCLMQFLIGPDLGRALAKGIAISLVTVFTFMPCLILSTYKWLDKLQHRPFVPSFRKFGKAVQKVMIPVLVIFILAIVPSYLASNSNSFYYGASKIFNEKTKTGADTAQIEDIFGKSDTYVLMVPKEDKATQKKLSDALHEIPQVKSIISYKRIFYIAYLIISSIQLGATVDYAILLTERYREYRQTCNKKDAITNTLSAVTVSILTSGSALTVVGFLMGIISTHGLLSQLGYFLGRGTLCSLVIVLFALPGMLYVFDGTFIKKEKKSRNKKIRVKKEDDQNE